MTVHELDVLRFWKQGEPFLHAHTSGSTGRPKDILIPRRVVTDSARRTNTFFGITGKSRLHSCVSAEFIGGKMVIIRALEAGCRYTSETPSNRPLASIAHEEHLSLLSVVPSMMWHILQMKEKQLLPEIDNILIGGSPIRPTLKKAIVQSGLRCYESYGMTETASHIAVRYVTTEDELFSAFPGIGISLDRRGCLVIKLDGTDEIVTNDIAEISDNNRFRIIGRADNVIISGGKKIFPEDVERRISHLIRSPFLVTSRPNDKWGQETVLLIESEEMPEQSVAGLLSAMRELLPAHELPHAVLFTSALPRTPNGKVLRKPLKE